MDDELIHDRLSVEAAQLHQKAAAIERITRALRDQAAALRELQVAEHCLIEERAKRKPPHQATTAEDERGRRRQATGRV